MKKLIAGNWKMNGSPDSAAALVTNIEAGVTPDILATCDMLVCPPFVHIPIAVLAVNALAIGAQDCSQYDDGAYTGDISAAMLKDTGCSYVILGHSERRQYFGETDASVRAKAKKANAQGLITIICVGETEAEREQGIQEQIVADQLKGSLPAGYDETNTVIAYEPVWAIGTGKTATADDIAAMHAFIRAQLGNDKIRILYGGSMKPGNAAEILATPNVDGGLIGGASLKAEDFLNIAKAA
jgi:triosephosphate isomerase